ncbi:MAG TPA: hypothetical protein VKK79_24360 [Candidatus Lokiarchaeia archaeon]|nr:hypothetical protein [Candidatus Lokiarchaeia archaeon]
MTEDLMKTLWILHKASGLCIYTQDFQVTQDIDVDADLFGGFVSALLSFSQEVSRGKAQLEEIALGPVKIVYDDAGNIIVSIAFNRKASQEFISDLVTRVTERFLERFANRLPPDKFDNNITPFKAFAEDLAEIYQPSAGGIGIEATEGQRNSVLVDEDYSSLSDALRKFLAGNRAASFEALTTTLKGAEAEEKLKVNNTIKMVEKFANKLGFDTDLEPFFEKVRTNTLGEEMEEDYGPLK